MGVGARQGVTALVEGSHFYLLFLSKKEVREWITVREAGM